MARYKHIDTSPRFIAVDLERQLLPGTFEHALHHLIDRELDLAGLDARYRNDLSGAPAYQPAHHSAMTLGLCQTMLRLLDGRAGCSRVRHSALLSR